jgi:hypothetical protein
MQLCDGAAFEMKPNDSGGWVEVILHNRHGHRLTRVASLRSSIFGKTLYEIVP